MCHLISIKVKPWNLLTIISASTIYVSTLSDHNVLQEDATALFAWSMDSDMDFNTKKSVHLPFKRKWDTTYTTSNACIPHTDSHKDLGLILPEDLSWDRHYKTIIAVLTKCWGYYIVYYFPAIQLLRWLVCMCHWSDHNYFIVPNMASTFDERHKSTEQVLHRFLQNLTDKTSSWRTCLNYMNDYLP